jgi:GT2 family glycosyltransferase
MDLLVMMTSICILTHNRYDSVTALLRSLRDLKGDNAEILVVDNHSSDNTSLIPSEFSSVRYFRTDKNIGAAGRNVAFSNASGDIIICLDDDVFGLTESMMLKLHDKFRNNPRIGAVNFKVLDAATGDICNWVHPGMPERLAEEEFLTYQLTEGAVAFRKEVLDRTDYYDESYFISHEGPDLAFQIMAQGYDCIYWPEVVVEHRHEKTGRVSWLNYYYDTRNQIYLAIKNFPFCHAAAYIVVRLTLMLVYSVRDGFVQYWIKAVLDGLMNLPRVWRKRAVLPEDVLRRIRAINRSNPTLLYKLRKRLFAKDARL